MLTKMTDADWMAVLRVFEASRSRRGDKGRDDKKFLSALHYFSVHNITWRTLPAEFGNWNSVWKRISPVFARLAVHCARGFHPCQTTCLSGYNSGFGAWERICGDANSSRFLRG